MTAREQWFYDRIGKGVFRSHNYCDCEKCKAVLKEGLVIDDAMHAYYLALVEALYNAEGYVMKYFDTKEEAENYAKNE